MRPCSFCVFSGDVWKSVSAGMILAGIATCCMTCNYAMRILGRKKISILALVESFDKILVEIMIEPRTLGDLIVKYKKTKTAA